LKGAEPSKKVNSSTNGPSIWHSFSMPQSKLNNLLQKTLVLVLSYKVFSSGNWNVT
jgi:hypothetical protein